MTILKFLRKILRKNDPQPTLAYVNEMHGQVHANDPPDKKSAGGWDMDHELDLSMQSDLEGYARGLSVSKESIERWISSGLLMPDELKVAEKLVKIMRNH